jgi:hypothetical protein
MTGHDGEGSSGMEAIDDCTAPASRALAAVLLTMSRPLGAAGPADPKATTTGVRTVTATPAATATPRSPSISISSAADKPTPPTTPTVPGAISFLPHEEVTPVRCLAGEPGLGSSRGFRSRQDGIHIHGVGTSHT